MNPATVCVNAGQVPGVGAVARPMTTICPKCLSDQVITVRIDDDDTITCGGCSEEYSLTDVAALVKSWGRRLAVLAMSLSQSIAGAGGCMRS